MIHFLFPCKQKSSASSMNPDSPCLGWGIWGRTHASFLAANSGQPQHGTSLSANCTLFCQRFNPLSELGVTSDSLFYLFPVDCPPRAAFVPERDIGSLGVSWPRSLTFANYTGVVPDGYSGYNNSIGLRLTVGSPSDRVQDCCPR